MKTLTCPICGKTFETHARNAVYCSTKCQHKGYYERHGRKCRIDAVSATKPITFNALATAKKKPANTSPVRWRMELRRRAMQRQFGRKNLDMLPHPDLLH